MNEYGGFHVTVISLILTGTALLIAHILGHSTNKEVLIIVLLCILSECGIVDYLNVRGK